MVAHFILNVLLTYKQFVIAGIGILGVIMYAIPLDELSEAFAAPGGGAKPPKPPGDGDGNYGHTVKPPKPPKPNN